MIIPDDINFPKIFYITSARKGDEFNFTEKDGYQRWLIHISENATNPINQKFFQNGWPFILEGSKTWCYVVQVLKDDFMAEDVIIVDLPETITKIKPFTRLVPMNQYDSGFTNEELEEYSESPFVTYKEDD